MSDITLSKAVRSNLLSLQNTANLMSKTQERLATGMKVNSALDNPTNFFTASSLNGRASDLGLLLDSVSNATQTLAAADEGISAITKLVESAQATARQALQAAATVETEVLGDVIDEANVTGTVDTAGTAAGPASGTGAALDGTADLDTIVSDGQTITITIDGNALTFEVVDDGSTVTPGNIAINVDLTGTTPTSINAFLADLQTAVRAADFDGSGGIDVSTFAVEIDTDGDVVFTLGAANDDDTIEFAGDVGTALGINGTHEPTAATDPIATAAAASQSLTVRVGTDDVQTITFGSGGVTDATALATALGDLDGVTATIDGDGFISITSTDGQSITIGGSAASTFGLATGTTQAEREASTFELEANPKRQELLELYNDTLRQIDDLAKDSHFNGVNLLDGDTLSVLFNEDGSSKLDIEGVTFSAAGLGLDEIADGTFDTNAGINGVLDDLKTGIDSLRTQASKFGANLSVVETRENFTKQMINVLQTGAANLTLADTNEEAANLLALQTRQQLSSVALSMASQADQNVLRLF